MHDAGRRCEICWRVIEGKSGQPVVCVIYETSSPEVELRVEHGSDQTIRAERLADWESARARADRLLATLRQSGFLESIRQ
jgi:hypothetical protein